MQEPPIAIPAPAREIVLGAVVVTVPPHAALETLLSVNPSGIESENATPVSATVFAAGFVIVNVSDEVVFTAISVGLKTLAIAGGATTIRLADAVPPVPPSVDITLPVVLFSVPAAVPVTLTENVQELVCARLAADTLTTLVPCVAVIVPPPQEPDNPFGVEITSPAGKVSLNAIPCNVVVVLLF
jgi:hypothetical protein